MTLRTVSSFHFLSAVQMNSCKTVNYKSIRLISILKQRRQMIQFDAISLSRTENCVCRRIPFAVEMYLIEFLLLLAFLRGCFCRLPPSFPFLFPLWQVERQVTSYLKPKSVPCGTCTLLEKGPGWPPLPFVGEFIAGLVIFSIRMFLEPNFNLQGNYLWSF